MHPLYFELMLWSLLDFMKMTTAGMLRVSGIILALVFKPSEFIRDFRISTKNTQYKELWDFFNMVQGSLRDGDLYKKKRSTRMMKLRKLKE